LELFFGKIRSRLGANNNPNALQLQYALKGILCYSVNASKTGNCEEQDEIPNKIPITKNLQKLLGNDSQNELEEDIEEVDDSNDFEMDLPSIQSLSMFIDNVVVYISGFVGKKLTKALSCSSCQAALLPLNVDDMTLRSDFTLLNEKTRGGLFIPSGDLIAVCKATERKIRSNLVGGISNIRSNTIVHEVVQDCLERCFTDIDKAHSTECCSLFDRMVGHKKKLIEGIAKIYTKIRLHHVAKCSTLDMSAATKRTFFNKLIHFSGH